MSLALYAYLFFAAGVSLTLFVLWKVIPNEHSVDFVHSEQPPVWMAFAGILFLAPPLVAVVLALFSGGTMQFGPFFGPMMIVGFLLGVPGLLALAKYLGWVEFEVRRKKSRKKPVVKKKEESATTDKKKEEGG